MEASAKLTAGLIQVWVGKTLPNLSGRLKKARMLSKLGWAVRVRELIPVLIRGSVSGCRAAASACRHDDQAITSSVRQSNGLHCTEKSRMFVSTHALYCACTSAGDMRTAEIHSSWAASGWSSIASVRKHFPRCIHYPTRGSLGTGEKVRESERFDQDTGLELQRQRAEVRTRARMKEGTTHGYEIWALVCARTRACSCTLAAPIHMERYRHVVVFTKRAGSRKTCWVRA